MCANSIFYNEKLLEILRRGQVNLETFIDTKFVCETYNIFELNLQRFIIPQQYNTGFQGSIRFGRPKNQSVA